jgi:hypothetical protein
VATEMLVLVCKTQACMQRTFAAVQADQRYLVVTIKHSGSLVTLSGEGFAAKNSVGNEFTAGEAPCSMLLSVLVPMPSYPLLAHQEPAECRPITVLALCAYK